MPSPDELPKKWPYQDDYPSSSNIPLSLEEKVANWKKANDVFFGPERDHKNFPHPVMPESVTETYQFGFIPTRWFKAIYPQLGVTGCYTVIFMPLLFGINKEIIYMGHEMAEILVMILVFNWARLKWGDKMKAKLQTWSEKHNNLFYTKPLEQAKSGYIAEVDAIKGEIARQEAVPVIFQAKQEQLDLQLEAEYRQRLQEVHDIVKRRLDYQADVEMAQRTFEQNHMVNWIVNSVKKSITPQQEKDSITSCIRTLKNLSASAKL